jgi:hypothetical protein
MPATDLGYLPHENPAHSRELELTFGRASRSIRGSRRGLCGVLRAYA